MTRPVLGDWAPSDSFLWSTHWDGEGGLPHLMPDFGPKHEMSLQCWCNPFFSVAQLAIAHNVAQ